LLGAVEVANVETQDPHYRLYLVSISTDLTSTADTDVLHGWQAAFWSFLWRLRFIYRPNLSYKEQEQLSYRNRR